MDRKRLLGAYLVVVGLWMIVPTVSLGLLMLRQNLGFFVISPNVIVDTVAGLSLVAIGLMLLLDNRQSPRP